jgi:DNA-binding MurR/RpiR family transcriptional regulator
MSEMNTRDPEPRPDVIETVRRQYDGLTQSQKRIAEAIIDAPEFVAFATVDKLANRLGVSPSTIVRFAYKVGLDGYQDLQARVQVLIKSQMRSANDIGNADDLTSHLADTPFAASLELDLDHLKRTIAALDRDSLERAVEVLSSADRIYVAGDNPTHALSFYFALHANRARDRVHLVSADGVSAARMIEIGPEDALIAFTFPPYSQAVLRTVEWAVECGAPTIGVTDHAVSPVGRRVSIVLPAVTSGLGPQNTLVPGMAVANALINALILADEQRSVSRYKAVNRLLNKWDVFVLGGDELE